MEKFGKFIGSWFVLVLALLFIYKVSYEIVMIINAFCLLIICLLIRSGFFNEKKKEQPKIIEKGNWLTNDTKFRKVGFISLGRVIVLISIMKLIRLR